jgi:hypothetical protein
MYYSFDMIFLLILFKRLLVMFCYTCVYNNIIMVLILRGPRFSFALGPKNLRTGTDLLFFSANKEEIRIRCILLHYTTIVSLLLLVNRISVNMTKWSIIHTLNYYQEIVRRFFLPTREPDCRWLRLRTSILLLLRSLEVIS